MFRQSRHADLLTSRKLLSYEEYAEFYQFHYVEDGSEQIVPRYHTGKYRLTHMQQHKRIYAKVMATVVDFHPKETQVLHESLCAR